MIYFCADDYGLCSEVSAHIKECIDKGAINKVSIFPNFDKIDLNKIGKDIKVSLHLNLVEGKCMANSDEIDLIADKDGNFKHTFGGLFKLNLLKRKKFEAQICKEIRAQVLFWKTILPDNMPFCIDSHQHTHMIPSIFRVLNKVLSDEAITVSYMRIPAEPIMPFVKTPSLYFTYKPVNIIKQWLLNILWVVNKKEAKKHNIHASHFLGILFSGKMDEQRVAKVLSKYQKEGRDIEVLFHPGYLENINLDFEKENIVFKKFYLSKNRKTEFNSVINIVINIIERSV